MLATHCTSDDVVRLIKRMGHTEGTSEFMRQAARHVLCRLEPAVLAVHSAAVAWCLNDEHDGVRKAALETLQRLEPMELLAHELALSWCVSDVLRDINQSGRWNQQKRLAALWTLGHLKPAVLENCFDRVCMDRLLRCLGDSDKAMQQAAQWALCRLEPAVLAAHGAAMAQCLREKNCHMRIAILELFLRPDVSLTMTGTCAVRSGGHLGVRVRMTICACRLWKCSDASSPLCSQRTALPFLSASMTRKPVCAGEPLRRCSAFIPQRSRHMRPWPGAPRLPSVTSLVASGQTFSLMLCRR